MKVQLQKSALRTAIAAFAAAVFVIALSTGCNEGDNPTGSGGGGSASIILPEGYAWVGDVSIIEESVDMTVRIACIPRANGIIDAAMQMAGIWQPMAPMATYSMVGGNLHLTEFSTGDTLIVSYSLSNNGNTMTINHGELGTVVFTKTVWPDDSGGSDPDTSNGGTGDHELVLGPNHAWVAIEGVPPMVFGISFVFNADSTFSTFMFFMIGWIPVGEGTWYTEGNRLFVTDEYGDTEEIVYAVAGNTLTMETEEGPTILTRTLWTGEVIDIDDLPDFDSFMSKFSDGKLPNWMSGRLMRR
jgi:hypothetical protein